MGANGQLRSSSLEGFERIEVPGRVWRVSGGVT